MKKLFSLLLTAAMVCSLAVTAGFIQKNIADSAIFNFEALHVLSADVDDEIHLRQKMLGSREMRDRLYNTEIGVECGLRQVLAVSGSGDRGNIQVRMLLVEPQ